jgi:predicted nuclease of predicted toxin-antitoxin system
LSLREDPARRASANFARQLADGGWARCIHTRDLPAQNRTRDGVINEISVRDGRVVINKDKDFFYSHILHGRPWKLLLVRTGNIRTGELRSLFARHLPQIELALADRTLVELDREAVTPAR